MAYYNTCPKCGANLDPGEPCDCEEQEEKSEHIYQNIKENDMTGQYVFCFDKRRKPPYMYMQNTVRKSTR